MKTKLLLTVMSLALVGTLYAQQTIEDFEGTGAKSVMNAISGGTASIVANPSKTGINTSDSVGKLAIDAVHDPWVGFWVSRKTDNDADSVTKWINANDNHYVHVMVYKAFTSNLKFKLEGSWSGTVEKYGTTPDSGKNTKINAWEDIVIDFSEVKGYVPIWLLSPDWDRPDLEGDVYFDNIVINNDPNPVTGTSVQSTKHAGCQVYPNPVTTQLRFTNSSDLSEVIISNILGVKVRQVSVTAGLSAISTSDLINGLYIVTFVEKSGKTYSSKIIKR